MNQALHSREKRSQSSFKSIMASQGFTSGLKIGEPQNAFQHEADHGTDELVAGNGGKLGWSLSKMGIGAPLQSKTQKLVRQRTSAPTTPASMSPIIRPVLNSPGRPLDSSTRNFFEPRFRYDLSRVRVHTDSEAASSARTVNTPAYAVGNHVVFGPGQYAPSTTQGRHILAHELTHVVQQAGFDWPTNAGAGLRRAGASQEREAERTSRTVLSGQIAPRVQQLGGPVLACFGDPTHHVIEEAALPGAGFTPEQMRSIERGNVQRDYSQVGASGNAVLLGQGSGFGGYSSPEHFDNFIFDAVTNRWRTRGAGPKKFLHLDPKAPDPSPIDYISGQLSALARNGMTNDSLVSLGNAFHTVEDFFAHSNFIELTQGDQRFGSELVTGSFGDNPANASASLAHTLEAVSTPQMQSYYKDVAEAKTQLTEPRSHSRLAKDTPSSSGFVQARRLAALVIQDLGADIISVMRNPKPQERVRLMNETVMAKIRQYLRPPDPQNPWWKTLVSRGGASMDARLAEAQKRTPVTINHAVFSPLRNLEASKDSNMAIPLGLAASVGGGTWLQVGAGVTRPSVLDPKSAGPQERADQRSSPFGGVQITGRF